MENGTPVLTDQKRWSSFSGMETKRTVCDVCTSEESGMNTVRNGSRTDTVTRYSSKYKNFRTICYWFCSSESENGFRMNLAGRAERNSKVSREGWTMLIMTEMDEACIRRRCIQHSHLYRGAHETPPIAREERGLPPLLPLPHPPSSRLPPPSSRPDILWEGVHSDCKDILRATSIFQMMSLKSNIGISSRQKTCAQSPYLVSWSNSMWSANRIGRSEDREIRWVRGEKG